MQNISNICAAGGDLSLLLVQLHGHPKPASPTRAQLQGGVLWGILFGSNLIWSILDLWFIWHIPISLFCLLFGGFRGAFCFQCTHTECFPENMLEIGLGFNSQWILGRSCPVAPSDYSQPPIWQLLNRINGGNNSVLCINTFNSS